MPASEAENTSKDSPVCYAASEHPARVTREQRARRNGHQSGIVWLTGLSGSGKSTLAAAVEQKLFQRGLQCCVLDGDHVRHGLNRDLGFAPEQRRENNRRTGEVAKLLIESGMLVIAAFISPSREDRAMVRSLFAEGEYVEVYVRCPLDVCERRDPKGLYRRARSGELGQFTGISAPYEAPESPELIIDTNKLSVEAAAELIIEALTGRFFT
jgi:adenylylsulfate kinase